VKVLFVDNFDSFTYNLVEYVSEQQVDGGRPETPVVKNSASLDDVRDVDPDAIVVSPGPGHPKNDRDVGVTADVLRDVSPDVPTLGVCLGMEAAVYEYGGEVGRAPEPIHGKTSDVEHDGRGRLRGRRTGVPSGPLPLAGVHGDSGLLRGVGHRRGRRPPDGRPPPRAPHCLRAVPPRERPDGRRPRPDS